MWDADNEIIHIEDLTGTLAEFGAHWYLLHRVDLHSELLRLSQLPEGKGIGVPVKIRLGAEVIEATDIETATIQLRNGEEIKKDFIVAADGVHVSSIPSSEFMILNLGVI